MKTKFVLALSDSQGHYHLLATNVDSKEEITLLSSKLDSWRPKPTPNPPYSSHFSQDDILDSLKKVTGHNFYIFEPDYYRSYGGNPIHLPCTYDWT